MIGATMTTTRRLARLARLAPGARRALSSASEPLVLVERNGDGTALVSLNRPPVNGFNTPLVHALTDAIKELEADPSVQGFMLASSGKVFSAGLDLNELYQVDERHFNRFWSDFETLWRTLYLSPLATVAAIESHAPAGGSVMALSCDYRVAADSKLRMGLNETQLGLLPPRWLQQLCARTVGDRNAEFILQTGVMMDVKTAHGYGFVDEVVRQDEVRARAQEILATLVAVPEQARATTKLQQREALTKLAGVDSCYELGASLRSRECTEMLEKTMQKLTKRK